MIEEIAALIPPIMAEQNGKAFYSGRHAFAKPTPFYIIGFNPGGAPEDHRSETIGGHTNFVLQSAPDHWSEYVDASWKGQPPGAAKLQRRLRHFLGKLGFDPRDVPSSNLIFTRSRRMADLGANTRRLEDMCWSFHSHAFERLETRAIFCLGGETSNRVRARLGASTMIDSFIETNNRGWQSSAWQSPDGKLVFGLTHPAIADWTKPDTDPSDMVQRCLAQSVGFHDDMKFTPSLR